MRFKQPSVLPGFGLTLGFTLSYLGLIVLIPLGALLLSAAGAGAEAWRSLASPRVLAAFRVSFGTAFAAALVNAVFGLIVAWVMVRYTFPGRRIVDSLIDLPFALPTAVAGIALTALYAGNGWLGQFLEPLGVKVAFTPLGIIVALIFIGLPFVVRTVEPVLQDLDREVEEAAASLGATRWQTFVRVILPAVFRSTLPDAERLSADQLVTDLKAAGVDARYIPGTDDIVTTVSREARDGDLVIIMSNGGFDDIHRKLLAALERPS